LSAQDKLSYIQFGKHNGSAFRVVKTPSGKATDFKTGAVLPDDPKRISIVTPENGESFHWPAADKKQVKMIRKNWGKIQKDPGTQYKMDQIRRSIVKGKKK
jgi:hypothetical protein